MDLDLAVSEGLADPAASAGLGEAPGALRLRRLRAGVADAAAV